MTVARSGLPWSASSGHKSGCFLKLGMLRFIPPMLFVAPSRSRPPEGNDRIWAAKVLAAPVVSERGHNTSSSFWTAEETGQKKRNRAIFTDEKICR